MSETQESAVTLKANAQAEAPASATSPAVFVQRCRVCSTEFQTPWGPETHTESARTLREHIERHSFTDLLSFALRQHFGAANSHSESE